MSELSQRGLTVFVATAFVSWSLAWCCGHPVLIDVAALFQSHDHDHHHHHEHDHAHDHAHDHGHAGDHAHSHNPHRHGPFEHDHDTPAGAGDHEIEKIGVDRCLRSDDELGVDVGALFAGAIDRRDALTLGDAATSSGPKPRVERPPDRAGRAVIASTQRWLI